MKTPQLQTSIWATEVDKSLRVENVTLPIQMQNSDGTGKPLVSLNGFGADLVRFENGRGVQNHVHEGDHILFVLSGAGTLTYAGIKHALYPGLCYFVPGYVEHAIDASENLLLIAVGNDHQPVGSAARMTPVSKGEKEGIS